MLRLQSVGLVCLVFGVFATGCASEMSSAHAIEPGVSPPSLGGTNRADSSPTVAVRETHRTPEARSVRDQMHYRVAPTCLICK